VKAARLASLVAVLALAACDSVAPKTDAEPVEYRPEMAGTVDHAMCLLGFMATPLRRLPTGHHVVAGTLNGKAATLVLDTGANMSVVHSSYAEQFGLAPQRGVRGAAAGLGGGGNASRSSVEALRLGSVDIGQEHVMLADLSHVEAPLARLSGTPIHGIIGQDVMRDHGAVIDVARGMLYLREAGSTPAPVAAERCTAAAAEG
jgi:predicted aspartyl protease